MVPWKWSLEKPRIMRTHPRPRNRSEETDCRANADALLELGKGGLSRFAEILGLISERSCIRGGGIHRESMGVQIMLEGLYVRTL